VVGYLCAEGVRAALPVYRDAGLALINPTISADYLRKEKSQHLFTLLYKDSDQAAFLAAYMQEGLGLTRVGVFSDESPYGRLLKTVFLNEAASYGLELVAEVDGGPTALGIKQAIQTFKDKKPEAVFLAAEKEASRLFLLEKQRQRLAVRVFGPDRLADLDFLERVGQAVEGLLLCQPILLETNNYEVVQFVNRFTESHNRWPDWVAAAGYDAMRLVLDVLKKSGPGRNRLLQAMRALADSNNSFQSLSGSVSCRQDGTCLRPLYVGVYQGGKLLPADPPTVEFSRE
jgi:branched-chain amino acid transport system substrate-binding protein